VLLEFSSFYRESYPKIFHAAYAATGQADTAADAAQEAFVRAFARWGRLQREPWVEGWVMTTALNLCKRGLRGRVMEFVARSSSDSEDTSSAVSEQTDLVAALRRLPFRQREAVILYYLGDLPIGTVANLMELTEGAVKAHLAQARKRLRIILVVPDA
jgi:RNA polymerase sigma-70 factor (ECF subfamily)